MMRKYIFAFVIMLVVILLALILWQPGSGRELQEYGESYPIVVNAYPAPIQISTLDPYPIIIPTEFSSNETEVTHEDTRIINFQPFSTWDVRTREAYATLEAYP